MTTNDARDAADGRRIELTRRQAVAGLGLAGLLGAGALSAAQQSSEPQTPDAASETWSARRREKYVRYSNGEYQVGSYEDGTYATGEPDRDDSVPVHSVDTVSSLSYVGASWHPHANPDPDNDSEGAWQHTFVLSNFGIGQMLFGRQFADRYEQRYGDQFDDLWIAEANADDTATVVGRPPRYTADGFEVRPGVSVQAINPAEDEGVVDDLAVSARRDLDLFSFISPDSLLEEFRLQTEDRAVEEEPSPEASTGRLDGVGDEIALSRASTFTDYGRLLEAYERATDDAGGDSSLPVADAVDFLRTSIGLLSDGSEALSEGEGGVALFETADDVANPELLDRIEKLRTIVLAADELLDDPEPVDRDELRFFNGFEQDMPGEAKSIGSGVVTFDVYVAPGEEGVVDVTSRIDVDETDVTVADSGFWPGTMEPTWRVHVSGPDAPSGQYASRDEIDYSELLNAEIVPEGTRFPSTHQTENNTFRGPKSWPREHTAFERRPRVPTPSISPRAGVSVETQERNGSEEVLWQASEDDDIAFDAHESVLCAAPIQDYTWELVRIDDEGTEDVVDGHDGADASVFHTEVPPLDRGDALRVRLTVEDAHAAVATTRDLDVEAAPPTPVASAQFDEAVVGQELSFDASESSTPAGTIDYRSWDVVDAPEAVREQIENAPDYVWSGSGETFSFTPHEPGDYAVSLTITDSRGYVRSDRVSFEVLDGPEAVVEPRFEGAHAERELTFDGSGSTAPNGIDAYEWSLTESPDGVSVDSSGSDSPTFSFTPPEPGTYVVELVVTANGVEAEATHDLAVEQPVDLDADFDLEPAPDALAGGDEVELAASASSDEVAAFSWQVDGWPRSDGQDAAESRHRDDGSTTSFDVTGGWTYRVALSVEGSTGSTLERSTTFDVETVSLQTDDGSVPTDVNGDGYYRDVNGDEAVSNGDVVDFFGNQHVDPWDSRTDLFDFDGDDVVGQSDVVELFSYVR